MRPQCSSLPKFKPVTHVIFDLDGVLLDTENIYYDYFKKIADEYGKTYGDEIRLKVAGTTARLGAQILIKDLELPLTEDELIQKFREYSIKKFSDDVPLKAGAERLVHHFINNKIPIAIATSSNQEAFKVKTQHKKQFFEMFHHVVCGGTDRDVKVGKPEPDIFLVCASRFEDNPKPEHCLIFEDAISGVTAALAAGMQVVMVPEPYVPYDHWKLATLRIDSLECMVPELFGLPPFPTPDES